jgi:hypothetical protein
MKTVNTTEATNPPIIDRASGAFAPGSIAIGINPITVASEVIKIGRSRTRTACCTAFDLHRSEAFIRYDRSWWISIGFAIVQKG